MFIGLSSFSYAQTQTEFMETTRVFLSWKEHVFCDINRPVRDFFSEIRQSFAICRKTMRLYRSFQLPV